MAVLEMLIGLVVIPTMLIAIITFGITYAMIRDIVLNK